MAAGDDITGGQRDALHAGAAGVTGDRGDLVGDIVHAAFFGAAFPPIEQGVAVKIALIHQIVVARDNIVELVERIGGGNFVAGHMAGASPASGLHRLCIAQGCGECRRIGQIKIAETVQPRLRHAGVIAHIAGEILDEIRAELRNLHIDRGAELLADAGIGQRCGGLRVSRVAFHHQHRPVEIGVIRQKPRDRRPQHRAADDDHVVTGFGGGLHQAVSPLVTWASTAATSAAVSP